MTQQGSVRLDHENIRKLLAAPRYLTGAVRSRLSTRDPRQWVIGSGFGPCDGALAFAQAARRLPDPPQLTWLASSVAECEQARDAGFDRVLLKADEQGRAATLRAGLVVITHGFGDVNRFAVDGAVIVHLGHGSPLKKAQADAPSIVTAGQLGRLPGVTRLLRWAYQRGNRRISLMPASAPICRPSLCSAYNIPIARVPVTGDPRTDVLFAGELSARQSTARALLESCVGPLGESRVIMYAPTWRDGEPDPAVPTPQQWALIEQCCARHDLVLVVRPHPHGIGDYTYRSDRVRLVPPDRQPESMPLLPGLAALITDYSSMLLDFAAVGEPIVALAPDLDRYVATRGLYFDYAELTGGSWWVSWDGVVDRLDELFSDSRELAKARAHSASLGSRFHTYTDGHNADRLVQRAAQLAGLSGPRASGPTPRRHRRRSPDRNPSPTKGA